MQKRAIDLSTVAGIGLALAMVALAIMIEGSFSSFLDFPSFLIVIMGTLLVTIACFSLSDVLHSGPVIYKMIFFKTRDAGSVVLKILELAENMRKKPGFENLEREIEVKRYDFFFKKGIRLLIDGTQPEMLEKIFTQEIISNADRHNKVVLIMRKAAETSPAMGLIGTLIGLVQMLSHLSDPSKLGPSMAIALLTTFYGAILSYVVFFPLASKIERNSREEILLERIYSKSILSIAKRENPRHLETILNSLLGPAKTVSYFKN
jgi:chemotaxis protein MotA